MTMAGTTIRSRTTKIITYPTTILCHAGEVVTPRTDYRGGLDGRAVPNFMAQAIRGEPLTVYGDGSQTRSLCYVSDLVRGVLAALELADELPVNLGNPEEVTVLELAQTIVRLAGSKSSIEFRELPVDDPKQRRPDIGRARSLLRWEPKVALEDGLGRTLEYFRSVV